MFIDSRLVICTSIQICHIISLAIAYSTHMISCSSNCYCKIIKIISRIKTMSRAVLERGLARLASLTTAAANLWKSKTVTNKQQKEVAVHFAPL